MYNGKIIGVPEILLPKKGVDMEKWAVIACDQFTSQGAYWRELDDFCGEVSALRIIFPEYYLGKCNMAEKVHSINDTMKKYEVEQIFDSYKGFILTCRTTSYGHRRIGIVLAVDLDAYDFTTGRLPIKATEATVPERLPVRVEIRENALLELPHVLMLIDDEDKDIIEPIFNRRSELKKLYDFDLNMNGGHVEGYLLEDTDELIKKFDKLINPDRLKRRYGHEDPFLFAVGDGNHSVATAKLIWDSIKDSLTEEERVSHPAKYVMVEVDNLYEDDLIFEAIHRVVNGVGEDFIDGMKENLHGEGHCCVLYRDSFYSINTPASAPAAVGAIQDYIDAYVKSHSGASVDYIHGDKNLAEVCAASDSVGIFMPVMEKSELFDYVSNKGSLPRKTFSMGEAEEKRYYLEARRIKQKI